LEKKREKKRKNERLILNGSREKKSGKEWNEKKWKTVEGNTGTVLKQ
jgi:hypothetical protein